MIGLTYINKISLNNFYGLFIIQIRQDKIIYFAFLENTQNAVDAIFRLAMQKKLLKNVKSCLMAFKRVFDIFFGNVCVDCQYILDV